jgi:hypothetical protein
VMKLLIALAVILLAAAAGAHAAEPAAEPGAYLKLPVIQFHGALAGIELPPAPVATDDPEQQPRMTAAAAPSAFRLPEDLTLLAIAPPGAAELAAPAAPAPFRVGPDAPPSKKPFYALVIAQHAAATFDAFATHRAVKSGKGRELNPFLRPFAGSVAIYGAIQAGPLATDWLALKMRRSENTTFRKLWWLPQTLSTGFHIWAGVNNLRVARR